MEDRIIVKLHHDREKQPVSDFMFGHFIEYMHDCIDPGMWAELLTAGGFETTSPETFPYPWVIQGNVHVKEDFVHVYSSGASIYIQPDVPASWVIISQSDLPLASAGTYQGYVCCLAQSKTKMEIEVKTSQDVLADKNFEIEAGSWKVCHFQFNYNGDSTSAMLSIKMKMKEALWLDQVSLRRIDNGGVWPQVDSLIQNLRPSILRFPGGCAADWYRWEHGIGPRIQRPAEVNQHWGGIERNEFGTDEYIQICRRYQSEPLICINFTRSPEEAANWVEYCNGDKNTPFGSIRARNGHPDPYGVKFWEIGNEIFGDWELGFCTKEQYVSKYLEYYKAMRAKDPSIAFLVCGGDGNHPDQSWNREICKKLKGKFQYLTLHFYSPLKNSNGSTDLEVSRAVMSYQERVACQLEKVITTMRESDCNASIAVTEWNCNFTDQDSTKREQTMEAAVANACTLNELLRHSDKVKICNFSDLVNGWDGGLIRSRNGRAYGTPTYYVLKLYSSTDIQYILSCDYACPMMHVTGFGNVPSMQHVPELDLLCTETIRGNLVLFAVNRSQENNYYLKIPSYKISRTEYLSTENMLNRNDSTHPKAICIQTSDKICDEVRIRCGEIMKLTLQQSNQ